MWPLGSAMYIWQCDVACGEKSRGNFEIIRHFIFSITFCRTTCQCIWGSQSQKPGTLCKGPPQPSLSLLDFPYSSRCLCIHSVNTLCLLSTFVGGRRDSSGWDTHALARWLPENVANSPVYCSFGEVKARPPLGLKGHFQNFFFCHLGRLCLSYFLNKLLNFIWLLWLCWGEELEMGLTYSTEIWCVGLLL